MVENIEKFRAELNGFCFTNVEIFHRGKVPLLNPRAIHNISTLISELSGLRDGIQLVECARIEPLVCRVRTGIRIANDIGPVTGEAGDFWRAPLQRDVG